MTSNSSNDLTALMIDNDDLSSIVISSGPVENSDNFSKVSSFKVLFSSLFLTFSFFLCLLFKIYNFFLSSFFPFSPLDSLY